MSDVFRKQYKPLTDQQKADMEAVKDLAQKLYDGLEKAVTEVERSERARKMNIARQYLETSIMWAVKAITE